MSYQYETRTYSLFRLSSLFYVLCSFPVICPIICVPSPLFPDFFSLFLIPRSFFVFCSLFNLILCSQFIIPFYLFPVCSVFPVYFSTFRVPYSMFHVPPSFLFLFSVPVPCSQYLVSVPYSVSSVSLLTVLFPMSLFQFLSKSLFPVLCSLFSVLCTLFYADCFSFNSSSPCPVPALVRRF
jgi:hypothetical protein